MSQKHEHDFDAEGEDAFIDNLERSNGVVLLGRMSGVKSNHRNMKREDDAAQRNVDLHEREFFGEESVASTTPGEEEQMDIMAARDVHIHKPSDAPQSPTAPPPQTKTNPLVPLAMAAAIGAGGLGLTAGAGAAGYALSQFFKTNGGISNEYDLGLLPPNPSQQ